MTLPLRHRPFDAVLAGLLMLIAIGALLADAVLLFLPGAVTPDSTNPLGRMHYAYSSTIDPLYLHPPDWLRFAIAFALFVCVPLAAAIAFALVRGLDGIHVPAVIYGTMASTLCALTMVVELFGDPALQTPAPVSFLAVNGAYLVVPLLVLARMRRARPFDRAF